MSWISVAGIGASVGGGILGSVLGGNQESPQHRAQRLYAEALYNPHGIMQARARDLQNAQNTYGQITGLYRQNIKGAKKLGQAGQTAINNWEQATNAGGDQSLINRGLYNTTVTDSQHRDTGVQANQQRQQVREATTQYRAGQRIGLAGALGDQQNYLQNFRNQTYDMQLHIPEIGLGGAPGYQLAQQGAQAQAGSNYGSLLASLLGSSGVFGGMGGGGGGGAGGYGTFGTSPGTGAGWGQAAQNPYLSPGLFG